MGHSWSKCEFEFGAGNKQPITLSFSAVGQRPLCSSFGASSVPYFLPVLSCYCVHFPRCVSPFLSSLCRIEWAGDGTLSPLQSCWPCDPNSGVTSQHFICARQVAVLLTLYSVCMPLLVLNFRLITLSDTDLRKKCVQQAAAWETD